ncbi:flagellar basal-body rod protein FlgF [Chitinasiproducens palmae]|uniref:Flagellar basal-body rod protein FlgF n=1 Tax=Chitinasiproducens palmae TaxID=1770053 RepID=A0A1H2PJS4_9BURK|nr:flagellar basal-body rod protein FlgF [Chitinasiproducens palmae]SDV46605.1 flagellar basal-body rod protein FlgF [Chitinasiproducens palmae]
MDRLIYVAASGASQALDQQATIANNLANTSTAGFRAQLAAYRAVPVEREAGNDLTTRTYALTTVPTSDFTPGPVQPTGNALDVAIQGSGWIAVQAADGSEAYTRAGNLHLDANGQLVTGGGLPVIGNGGPIAVPPATQIDIANDGTISTRGAGDTPTAVAVVDKIKLVNPPAASLTRGDDGLFRAGEEAVEVDPTVRVTSGAVEGSNVNPVTAMVAMIDNARAFQMHMKVLDMAATNEQTANQLLNFSG